MLLTISKIKDEASKLKAAVMQDSIHPRKDVNERELRRVGKKLRLLTECQYYLETKPREGFIREMLGNQEGKLALIEANYSSWASNADGETQASKNMRAVYDTEMGTKQVKFQIKVLKYLLGE